MDGARDPEPEGFLSWAAKATKEKIRDAGDALDSARTDAACRRIERDHALHFSAEKGEPWAVAKLMEGDGSNSTWNAAKQRWTARLLADGKSLSIGYFMKEEDAVAASDRYQTAKWSNS